MALTLVIIVSFRKFYLGILLKRKFLAKPRYATFQKNSLKIAHIYNQTMSWEGGCNLAPQAHGTLLFISPCCMLPFATGPSFHLPGLWFLRYVFLWHFVFFSCCGGFLRHESCSKPVKRRKKKIFFLGPKTEIFLWGGGGGFDPPWGVFQTCPGGVEKKKIRGPKNFQGGWPGMHPYSPWAIFSLVPREQSDSVQPERDSISQAPKEKEACSMAKDKK